MYNKKIDFKTTEIPTNIEGSVFNREIFDKSGIFIVKNYIGNEIMSELQNSWNAFIDDLVNKGGRTIDNSNFVNFSDNLPPELMDFWKSEVVKKIAIAIWGDDVALYNSRIVMKDKKSEHIVMLHQDNRIDVFLDKKIKILHLHHT